MRRSARRAAWLLACGWVLGACEGRDAAVGTAAGTGGAAGPASVRDSAGIEIVETPASVARAPSGWTVAAEPALVIGREGEADYEFSDIQGVRRLADGGFAVLDRASADVRFFDEEGRFVTRIGGAGNGPGEFARPAWVHADRSDSLFIFDSRLARLTAVAADGSGFEVHSFSERLQGTVTGRLGDRWIAQTPFAMLRSQDGLQPAADAVFFEYDPRSGASDTIFAGEGVQFFRVSIRSMSLPFMFGVPFKIPPTAALDSDRLVINPARGGDLLELAPGGTLRRILRIDEPPRLVGDAELDQVPELVDDALRDHLDEMPIPETVPSFRRVMIDSGGWLWAETFRPSDSAAEFLSADLDQPTEWVLFDPDGRAAGAIVIPGRLYLRDAGPDWLLGIHVDALGVQTVRLHGLARRR